jgi:hypothetical protein
MGGADVQMKIFLTLVLAGGEQSASQQDSFTPRETAPFPL